MEPHEVFVKGSRADADLYEHMKKARRSGPSFIRTPRPWGEGLAVFSARTGPGQCAFSYASRMLAGTRPRSLTS